MFVFTCMHRPICIHVKTFTNISSVYEYCISVFNVCSKFFNNLLVCNNIIQNLKLFFKMVKQPSRLILNASQNNSKIFWYIKA